MIDDLHPCYMKHGTERSQTELIRETHESLAEVQLSQNIVQRAPHWQCAGPKPLFP